MVGEKVDKVWHGGKGLQKCHFVSDVLFEWAPSIVFATYEHVLFAKKLFAELLDKLLLKSISIKLANTCSKLIKNASE